MPKREEYYPISDGYSIVGYGFHCVLCGLENNFVNTEYDEQFCTSCGHITFLKPIPSEEQ